MLGQACNRFLGFSLLILSHNALAAVYLVERDLNSPIVGKFFAHSFLEVQPDAPSDFGGNTRWTMSAYNTHMSLDDLHNSNRLANGINYPGDIGADPNKIQNIWKIPTPPGKTDSQFIAELLNTADRYPQNSRKFLFEGNCHQYTTSLLTATGVSDSFFETVRFRRLAPGFGKVFPEMMADGNSSYNPNYNGDYTTDNAGSYNYYNPSFASDYSRPNSSEPIHYSSDVGATSPEYSSVSDYTDNERSSYERPHLSERVSDKISEMADRVSERWHSFRGED